MKDVCYNRDKALTGLEGTSRRCGEIIKRLERQAGVWVLHRGKQECALESFLGGWVETQRVDQEEKDGLFR